MSETHPPVKKRHKTSYFHYFWMALLMMLIAFKPIIYKKFWIFISYRHFFLVPIKPTTTTTHNLKNKQKKKITQTSKNLNIKLSANTHANATYTNHTQQIKQLQVRTSFHKYHWRSKRDCVLMWNSVHNIKPLPSEVWWRMHLQDTCWLLQRFPWSLACMESHTTRMMMNRESKKKT